jgi:hypothetical protein
MHSPKHFGKFAVEVIQNEECIRLMEEFIRQNSCFWSEDNGM